MRALRRRANVVAAFALLALVAELAGRELTEVVDRALHVAPLATPGAPYYPFLLVAVKVVGALALAALAWRVVRALSTAVAGERLLSALGHRCVSRLPWPRFSVSPKLWAASFVATSLWYLVQSDAGAVSAGRWPLLAPWLHTYALPVFAVLSVVVAAVWRLASWMYEVEDYAVRTLARCRKLLGASLGLRNSHPRATDDGSAPRRRFGLAFECRPPPLAA
jgi:hypothetical protein